MIFNNQFECKRCTHGFKFYFILILLGCAEAIGIITWWLVPSTQWVSRFDVTTNGLSPRCVFWLSRSAILSLCMWRFVPWIFFQFSRTWTMTARRSWGHKSTGLTRRDCTRFAPRITALKTIEGPFLCLFFVFLKCDCCDLLR